MQRAAPGRRAPELATRVTAAGVLRTVVIDTLVGSEATGYSWIRRVKENGATSGAGASSGTGPQEVTPMAARSVEPAGAYRTAAPETAPAVNDLAAPLKRGGAANSFVATSTEWNVRVLPTGHADPVSTATEGPDGGADPPIAKGQMSVQRRRALSTFMSTAVLPKTNRVYEKEWESFKAFVKMETGSDNPFLTECTEDEKATLVA
jgi:hypothetical protein